MNKSLFIASFVIASATVSGMHTDENNQKRCRSFLYTSYPKQTWRVTDSQEGIEEKNSNQEIMNLLKDIGHKTAESEKKNSELKEENYELTEKIQQTEERVDELAEKLFVEKVSQAKPNNEKKQLQKRLNKLEKKYKNQKKTNENLRKKLKESPNPTVQELSEFIEELKTELRQKELSEDKLKTENKELKNQIEFLESNKGKENKSIKELEEEINDLNNQLQESDSVFKDLEEDLRKKEAELDQKNEVIEQIRNDFEDLQAKYNNLLNFKDTSGENGSKTRYDAYEWEAIPTYYQVNKKMDL